MGRTRENRLYKFALSPKSADRTSTLLDNRLQWDSSIIILPAMPYVFSYEDIFVGVIGVLILSLLVLRYVLGRKRD